jgi:hypothetical protein
LYNIYVYLHRCKVGGCKWVRVCVLAHACDRVRALTMREYAACVRVRRAHFVSPSMEHARVILYRYMMHACIYIHARLATPTNGSPMRNRCGPAPHTCAHVLRPCARVCARAIGRPHIRADACERVPSAWTAVGSAHRRSTRRRRSTRTSARGTPLVSPRCTRYAPPFRPRRRATAGGTRSVGRRCRAGLCARRDRRCARVCAQTCGPANGWVPTCVGVAARSRDELYACVYMYVYICTYVYIIYLIYIYRHRVLVREMGMGVHAAALSSNAHVRAIARADDAAVAVTCARGYVLRDI